MSAGNPDQKVYVYAVFSFLDNLSPMILGDAPERFKSRYV